MYGSCCLTLHSFCHEATNGEQKSYLLLRGKEYCTLVVVVPPKLVEKDEEQNAIWVDNGNIVRNENERMK